MVLRKSKLWLPCRGDFGRLGHGDIIDVFIPKPIAGLSGIGITRLACGDTHTLALSATGQVYSFGRNQNGQLGTGCDKDSLSPVHIEALRVRSKAIWQLLSRTDEVTRGLERLCKKSLQIQWLLKASLIQWRIMRLDAHIHLGCQQSLKKPP